MSIIGLLIALLGFYMVNKGSGADKPVGICVIGIGWFLIGLFDLEHPINMLIGGIIFVVGLLACKVWVNNENDGTNARRRADELEQIERERLAAIESQKEGEPWRIIYATYPCPHCGHYKVRSAKWEDKRASVAFWGSASNAIGKQYKCEHCGEMW